LYPSGRSEGDDVETSHHGIISANLLQCEQENLTVDRVDSAMKLTGSYKLPNTIEDIVAVKSKGETQACGKPPNDKLTNDKKKAPAYLKCLQCHLNHMQHVLKIQYLWVDFVVTRVVVCREHKSSSQLHRISRICAPHRVRLL
jgi:hypothetical protein